MPEGTWLYLYENRGEKQLYIGVADSLDRIWEHHNPDAKSIREAVKTQVLRTVQPFSSRQDALQAEAVAIHVAMLAGVAVHHARDGVSIEDGQVQVSNRAGTGSTSILVPAVKRREGVVDFADLKGTGTAIVTIAAEDMDDRQGPYAELDGATFAQRAQKWWKVAPDKQPKIKRLIAILAGSGGVILGDWDVDSSASYGPDDDVFPLKDPASDDPREVKGKRLTGVRGQTGRIYSADLRG